MEAWNAVNLIRKYNECERCGNGKVGNGEGTLEITENKFVRSCKCGWRVEINKGGDE